MFEPMKNYYILLSKAIRKRTFSVLILFGKQNIVTRFEVDPIKKNMLKWYHAQISIFAPFIIWKNLKPEPNYFEWNFVTFIIVWTHFNALSAD